VDKLVHPVPHLVDCFGQPLVAGGTATAADDERERGDSCCKRSQTEDNRSCRAARNACPPQGNLCAL
jgi:hypothetical protein